MRRRSFLRKTVIWTPLLAASPSILTTSCKETLRAGSGKTAIVVGAGISGIYIANLLLQEGFEVSVLEAAGQWGGRIRTLEGFADFPIEGGAEEIRGEKSDWFSIVKASKAILLDKNGNDFYHIDKRLLTQTEAEMDEDVKKLWSFISQIDAYSGPDKTVDQEYMMRNLPARVRPTANAQIGNEYGSSNARVSIKGLAEERKAWTAGEKVTLVGNRGLQRIVQQAFPAAMEKITLHTAVKKITYTSGGVAVEDDKGLVRKADIVVVTAPVSVLRDGDIAFDPPLPPDKADALKKIGMGAGMKVILKFTERFWNENTRSIYGSGLTPEYWHTSLGRGQMPILTAFIMGERAEALSLQGQQAVQTILADLDAIFGNQAASKVFLDARIIDWSKEPYIKGAYSYPAVGGGLAFREILARPLEQKVFFAGEATHAKGHSGTVHGALESAQRVFKEIIR